MLQPERHRFILSAIDSKGFVSIAELMELCRASKSTIHRDLEMLEASGKLTRTRGGAATPYFSMTIEPSLYSRQDSYSDEKRRIAQEAFNYIRPHDTILLDSGTTAHALARQLIPYNKNLMVATSDLNIAYDLASNTNINMIVAGGLVRKNYFSMVGTFCEDVIKQLHADTFFMGIDAIDVTHGCMCYSLDEMQIKRAMLHAAKRTILLSDHSKFSDVAFVSVCKLSAIDLVITGKELDEKYVSALQENNIPLVQV